MERQGLDPVLAGDRGNRDELLVIPSGSSRGGGLGHEQGIERGHVDLLPKNKEKWEAAVDPRRRLVVWIGRDPEKECGGGARDKAPRF